MNNSENPTIYCRKLGHWVDFGYCIRENNNLPCCSIVNCWTGRIDIYRYLEQNFSREELSYLSTHLKPKIVSIIELAELAKKRGRDGGLNI